MRINGFRLYSEPVSSRSTLTRSFLAALSQHQERAKNPRATYDLRGVSLLLMLGEGLGMRVAKVFTSLKTIALIFFVARVLQEKLLGSRDTVATWFCRSSFT